MGIAEGRSRVSLKYNGERNIKGGDAKGGRELPGSTHLVLIVRQPSP